MNKRSRSEPITIIDRLGVALLTSAVTFVSVLVLWMLVTLRVEDTIIPFEVIWWISGFMGFLGLIFAERLILTVIGYVWDAIRAMFYWFG